MGDRRALVGRDREADALAEFLDAATPSGLVLTGEAGLGKSALWSLAVDLATERGALVLQATPGEGEDRYSFSVLLDLFHDVDLAGVSLRPPVRTTLEAVLLRGTGSGPVDPQVVSAGVVDVLNHLSVGRQVVLFVDDVQWADTASMEALAFAARRLGRAPVQYVLTRRADFERSHLEAALVRRELRYVEPRPLTVEETARLLNQALTLTLTPRVLRQVHEQSGGNPLFSLEVGRALLERGVPEIGEPLGVPSEMATMFGLRVRDLDRGQRMLLLAVAIDPHLSEVELVELVGVDEVERAVRDRLVTLADNGRVRAWHPLLAAAARQEATPGRRRELHSRLAEIVDRPDPRLRHRALALVEPDEQLADQLSVAAEAAGDRGAFDTALELAELALTRTSARSPDRVGRVLGLASRMGLASEAQQLSDFLEPEIATMPHGAERGQAWLMMLDGMVGSVANMDRIVDRALAECAGDPQVRAHAFDARAFIAGGIKVSGVAQATTWADEAMAFGAGSHSRDWCLVHSGRPPETPVGPPHWKRLIWRGEMAAAEDAVRAAMASAEEAGRLQEAMALQVSLSDVLVRCGRIAEARALAALQEDLDLMAKEPPDEELLKAEIEVAYGDVAAARHWGRITLQRATDFGHVWIALEADRALAVAALRAGEPEEAEERLRDIFDRTLLAGVREPGMFPVSAELVEALALLGQYDEAREVLAWLDEVSAEQAHPWGTAMAERSRLLIGVLDGSVSLPDGSARMVAVADDLLSLGLAHDAARAHLVLGSALRRHRQWGRARDHLLRAAAIFEELGADGWAEAARGELTRVGGRRPAAEGALTSAELAAAQLAVSGLPNKLIARQLNISISTVEAHLSHAYAKLGVQSRSQLAAKLNAGH